MVPSQKLTLLSATTPNESLLGILRARLSAMGITRASVSVDGTAILVAWNGAKAPAAVAPHLTTRGVMGIYPVLAGPTRQELERAYDASIVKAPGVAVNEERWVAPQVTPDAALRGYKEGTRARLPSTQKLAVLEGTDPKLLEETAAALWPPPTGRWVAVPRGATRWITMVVASRPVVTHEDVGSAEVVDTSTGTAVWAELSRGGTQRFHDYTKRQVGGRICIVVDDKAFSCPVIMEPISEGHIQLTLANAGAEIGPVATALVHGPLPSVLVYADR